MSKWEIVRNFLLAAVILASVYGAIGLAALAWNGWSP